MSQVNFTFRELLALASLLLVAPAFVGCGSDSSASTSPAYAPRGKQFDVQVATVLRRPLHTEAAFTGNLLPRRVTRVTPEIDGIVRDIPQVGAQFRVVVQGKQYSERLGIAFGQFVKQGDVLLQLDPRDAEVALQMADAKLKKAQADLAKLQSWERPEQIMRLTAMRDEARARHELSVSNSHRIERLRVRETVTQSDLEHSLMEVSTAKATLDAADAVLAQAQSGPTEEEIVVQQALIAQAEAEVRQQQRNLEKATIHAPYDGVITAFNVEVGDRVSPGGNPVVEVMDLRYLVAEVALPESFIGRVKVQDEAAVTMAGSSASVPGLVVAINALVDPQTRTFQVRVAIDNERRAFKAGQFASVKLGMGARGAQMLAVPNASIIFVEGQPHVFVVNGGRVKAVSVELGVSNQEVTEILRGVQEGDVVVVDDPSLLSDGMTVTVKQEREAADRPRS